jgi:hypothetical protein
VRLSTPELLASTLPVHRAASAHVLAADSDYSLVKELQQKSFRVSYDTLATALAMAPVRLPTIPYPASLSRLASRFACVSRCWVANLIASFSVVNRLLENSFQSFSRAVNTLLQSRSRCIGEQIIGSLTDSPPSTQPAGLFLFYVGKKDAVRRVE